MAAAAGPSDSQYPQSMLFYPKMVKSQFDVPNSREELETCASKECNKGELNVYFTIYHVSSQ